MKGKFNGTIERTAKKIKYLRKKKSSRNNMKSQIRKTVQYGDY